MADSQVASSDSNRLPWRRRYSFLLIVLLLISIVSVSFKRSPDLPRDWSMEVSIGVSAITLTLLILLAAPIFIPWLIQLAPRLRAFFIWTRGAGIEEVEIAGFHLKLASLANGVAEAAKNYETDVLQADARSTAAPQGPESITAIYTQMLEHIETSTQIPSGEAIRRIDQLSAMYEEVRSKLPSSAERTQLLTQISGVMWSLMTSVDEFGVAERIVSPDGGRRLAAYKYIEANAHTDQLDLLLSRAIGVLETPFGQYAALLALRRVVASNGLEAGELDRVSKQLSWAQGLAYIARTDRAFLMRNVLGILRSR